MKQTQRIVLGSLGALIPSIAVLFGITSLESMDGRWGVLAIKTALVVLVGAVMAYVQNTVKTRAGALQIGMAVPGLLSGLLASPELRNIHNDAKAAQDISDRAAPTPPPEGGSAPPPANDLKNDDLKNKGAVEPPSLPLWPFGATVYAQAKIPKVSRDVGLLERLGVVTKRNWYVVVESYPVLSWAQTAQKRYGKSAEILQHPQDGQTLYVVVDGQQLSYDDAAARANRKVKGFKPYAWNPDLRLAPPAGCSIEEIEENDVSDVEIGWGNRPLYAWIGAMAQGNPIGICLTTVKPTLTQYPNPADFSRRVAGAQCLSLPSDAPGPSQNLRFDAEGYRVSVAKIDWDRPGAHDIDLRVCRIS